MVFRLDVLVQQPGLWVCGLVRISKCIFLFINAMIDVGLVALEEIRLGRAGNGKSHKLYRYLCKLLYSRWPFPYMKPSGASTVQYRSISPN
jgi:hypothetical protein